MSWPETSLGDIAEFRNGLNYTKENEGEGLRVINVKDFGDKSFPDYEDLGELNPNGILREEALLKHGDIVFVRSNGNKDLVGRSLFVDNPPGNVSFSAFCIRARINKSANPYFYSYFFRTPHFRKRLALLGKGTNISNLNQQVLKRIRVPNPSGKEKTKVVDFIRTYDDLIENNRRRIQLLEQGTRLLYKEWFVHLRFPGHEHTKIHNGIPGGWEKKPINDVWEISYGKNLPTSRITATGKFPVHGADGIIGYHTEKNVDSSLCLVTCRGNGSGNVRRTFGPTFVTNNCFVLRPKYKSDSLKFHYAITAMEALNLRELRTGAAQPQLTLAGINHLHAMIPSDSILSLYNSVADPLYDQADCLRKQNSSLAKARDLLLPRLMNGEVEV